MKKMLAMLITVLSITSLATAKTFNLRFVNFTPDEFFHVKVTDTRDKSKVFFDGRLEDQEYTMLKNVNTKNLPLNVTVQEPDAAEPTELLIEDVTKEGIKVEPKDLWILYRDNDGMLQITEVNEQK